MPHTVNNDGTYAISDPNGNLLTGYEVPGFVLMIEAANAGPNRNTIALITAVESVPVRGMSRQERHRKEKLPCLSRRTVK